LIALARIKALRPVLILGQLDPTAVEATTIAEIKVTEDGQGRQDHLPGRVRRAG
jgi:hypothetical protein